MLPLVLGLLSWSLAEAPVRAAAADREPRHVALLIGIADYEHFSPDGPPGTSDLLGPGNDVERMRVSLRRWGFDGADDVRILRDAAASRAGIAAAFAWLAARATEPHDVVVVYFSGHGTQVPDDDGDEALTTPGDTLDEALVPWDARDPRERTQVIVDDDIRTWLNALGTRNVTVIIDACYSGTVTRGMPVAERTRVRGPLAAAHGSGAVEALDHPEHTLITAARADQPALEMPLGEDGAWFGVLTYHLASALDGASPMARYDDILAQVRRAVRLEAGPQEPQLEGDGAARVFRVRHDVPRRAFAVITAAADGRAVIDAGAVHGVRQSAVYDLYSAAAAAVEAAPSAQLVIDSVSLYHAAGRLTGAAAPGTHARLALTPRGSPRLTRLDLFVAAPTAPLRAALGALPFVRLVNDEQAAAQLVAAEGGLQLRVHGHSVVPLSAAEDVEAPALCHRLVRALAASALLAIRNPQPPADFELHLQFVPAGAAPLASPPAVDTLRVGRAYDLYARVEAPATARLYLTVAVAGYTSQPTVLWPRERRLNQPFPLNRWVRLHAGVDAIEPAGSELLKAVVDADQFDFFALIDGLPACGERATRWTPAWAAADVSGWTAVSRWIRVEPAERAGTR